MLTLRRHGLAFALWLPVIPLLLAAPAARAQSSSTPRSSSSSSSSKSRSSSSRKLPVKIDSQPSGAKVYIDDRAKGVAGTTPTTIQVSKGSHQIILELEGYAPAEKTLQIDRAQNLVFPLLKQARPATLDVRGTGDGSAAGASVSLDGTQVGTVPTRVEVAPGAHLLEVTRSGYVPYRETLQLGENENRTVVVVLPLAQRPGSLVVVADVPGAVVYVDGQRKDTVPAVIEGLSEGGHVVEVQKEGLPKWSQAVTVLAGQQVKVAATLTPAAPAAGSIKVLSSAPGAEVFLDGDLKGQANREIRDVRPGGHIVEVRAPGFSPKSTNVEVAADEQRVIQVDLVAQEVPQQPKTGTLRVISAIPFADVYVDGALVGQAPIDRSDMAPGRHIVVVHRDGFADYKEDIVIEPGGRRDVVADLRAVGVLRVISNLEGALVYLDGTQAGKTPVTIENVSVGQHVVELRAPGHDDARQSIIVTAGQQQVVQADLHETQGGPRAEDLLRARREQSSFGATVLDRGHFNVDVGTVYPYYISARLVAGVIQRKYFGFDIGVELRSTLHETDVGIRPRVQFIRLDPIAVGLDVTILGGGGPLQRNAFTFEVGPIVTLLAGKWVRFSVKPYYGYYNDRLCPSVSDIQADDRENGDGSAGSGPIYSTRERAACKNFDGRRPSDYLPASGNAPLPGALRDFDTRGRFVTHRFLLQGVVEVLLKDYINLWVLVEGAPGQGERQSFTKKFNSFFPTTDFPFYVRAGVSFKF